MHVRSPTSGVRELGRWTDVLDGLACAVLLVEAGIVNRYKFVHPKDVQDGKVTATKEDVLANIPFIKGCGLWFDQGEMRDLIERTVPANTNGVA